MKLTRWSCWYMRTIPQARAESDREVQIMIPRATTKSFFLKFISTRMFKKGFKYIRNIMTTSRLKQGVLGSFNGCYPRAFRMFFFDAGLPYWGDSSLESMTPVRKKRCDSFESSKVFLRTPKPSIAIRDGPILHSHFLKPSLEMPGLFRVLVL